MPVKYIPYFPNTVEGQAILNNFIRSRRSLQYRDNDKVFTKIKRGMPYYETELIEQVRNSSNTKKTKSPQSGQNKNMLIRGECISACAYLKEQGIEVDLVYIDPPFASGADYAKKVYIRRNPKIAEAIIKAEEEMDIDELRAFEEKMYGDIWNKEAYLNWMYENLLAIKSIMSATASIYVHLDWHIGHYVKILMDEVFGEDNFLNEVVWYYSNKMSRNSKDFSRSHDSIFFYKISDENNFNEFKIVRDKPVQQSKRIWTGKKNMRARDENGSVIYELSHDITASDVWDIPYIASTDNQRLDYATQKPEALLERIIKASSNEGMLIADFFGGSGVTAKVADDLKRNFIHVDVGLNSLQTSRDRLIAAKTEFDILEIKDGVNLFRNPVQTMDKLKKMITGLRNEDKLDKFWEGAIQDSKLGAVPVYLPNLLDHTTKVLDIPLMNRIINEAVPDLPESIKRVIVFYIDIDDKKEVEKFIKEQNILIEIELRDLKLILDDVRVDDIIEYDIKVQNGEYEITFTKFISDRLRQKIEEFNQKGLMQPLAANNEEEQENINEEEETPKKKKKFKPIVISPEGLELIELISLDCTNKDGNVWQSDKEIKIDKLGYVIEDGKKTKTLWNSKITSSKKPLRLKIRNITGDEIILKINTP